MKINTLLHKPDSKINLNSPTIYHSYIFRMMSLKMFDNFTKLKRDLFFDILKEKRLNVKSKFKLLSFLLKIKRGD